MRELRDTHRSSRIFLLLLRRGLVRHQTGPGGAAATAHAHQRPGDELSSRENQNKSGRASQMSQSPSQPLHRCWAEWRVRLPGADTNHCVQQQKPQAELMSVDNKSSTYLITGSWDQLMMTHPWSLDFCSCWHKQQRVDTGDSWDLGGEGVHTAHQIGALQFQLQKILFGTSQKCRDGQQTLISCTSFQILHLQLAVLFQTKSPMSTFSVSGPKILSHIMPRSADDDTVSSDEKATEVQPINAYFSKFSYFVATAAWCLDGRQSECRYPHLDYSI